MSQRSNCKSGGYGFNSHLRQTFKDTAAMSSATQIAIWRKLNQLFYYIEFETNKLTINKE